MPTSATQNAAQEGTTASNAPVSHSRAPLPPLPPPPSQLPDPPPPARAAPAAGGSSGARASYFAWAPLDPLVAGLTAGTLTTLTLHPFDLIKTRLQVGLQSPGTARDPVVARHYGGSIHAARVLVAHEGWRSLWKGLSPNLAGNAAAWGLYFCGFEIVKHHLSTHEPFAVVRWLTHPAALPPGAGAGAAPRRPLNALEHVLAASFTGVCVLAMTNPIWVVKTRMFLDRTPIRTAATTEVATAAAATSLPSSAGAGSAPSINLWNALRSLYAAEGLVGLYRGFVPGLLGVSHGALQFMAYEELKRLRMQQRRAHNPSTADAPWSALETVSMSALSKAFAAFITYPYQTVRSRLQAAHGNARPTFRRVVMDTWHNEGVRGFYRGSVINIVRVMPAACSVFLIYEQVNGFFRTHARERASTA